ncbi:MAG: sulfite exporter TauE/SafE family protein [Burkholderiales bacterium]|nr:sulfite exporter TauE/SafE family protein [Burkholderiales bacterium]
MDLLAIFSGFLVGTIVGLTGVGGGSLMTPLLIGVFKLHPATAIGTDLWFAALTKAGGSVTHHRLGHVDARVTGLLLAGSLPATLLMIAWMHGSGSRPVWGSALTLALGVALLLTAVSVAYRRAWAQVGLRLERWLPPRRRDRLTVAAGAALGVLVSLSSVGAGALGATLLLLLYPRFEPQRIVGTDIAHAVPLTLVAGIGHATLGHVDWSLLGTLLLGSLPGIWLGARLTRALPEIWVRSALCLSLTAAGLKVLA